MVLCFLIISEDVVGFENLWFVGDNFMAGTYRNHFKRVAAEMFLQDGVRGDTILQ